MYKIILKLEFESSKSMSPCYPAILHVSQCCECVRYLACVTSCVFYVICVYNVRAVGDSRTGPRCARAALNVTSQTTCVHNELRSGGCYGGGNFVNNVEIVHFFFISFFFSEK